MQQSTLIAAGTRSLRWLASMRLTQALLAMLGLATLLSYLARGIDTLTLGVPLALLVANLLAAVITNPSFRRQPALLVFHLSLVAITALLAVAQLTAVSGRFELTEGVPYDGTMLGGSRGPWSRQLVDASFVQRGFAVEYDTGMRRGRTRNDVVWVDDRGIERQDTIGDQKSLQINGYRFYTTSNKGFAPLFDWMPDGGTTVRGAVHLPSYPLHEHEQTREWRPSAASAPIRVSLRFDERVLQRDQPAVLRKPDRHAILVRVDGAEAEMQPGESVRLAGGTLRYVGLRTWMGYRVTYDQTSTWLLAAALVAVAALLWHYIAKFRRRPW
jgi:cytochrome c biogenesis protein ResB